MLPTFISTRITWLVLKPILIIITTSTENLFGLLRYVPSSTINTSSIIIGECSKDYVGREEMKMEMITLGNSRGEDFGDKRIMTCL